MSNSDLNGVMATIVKIVHFIVKWSSLMHRHFQSLLEEVNKDIPLHSAERWLSCGKVLERFVGCFDSILPDWKRQSLLWTQRWDMGSVTYMFLTDITGHFSELNLWLQGAEQIALNMFETWAAFVDKLAILSRDNTTAIFRYFSHVRELSMQRRINRGEISKYISEIESAFTTWFGDIRKYGLVFFFDYAWKLWWTWIHWISDRVDGHMWHGNVTNWVQVSGTMDDKICRTVQRVGNHNRWQCTIEDLAFSHAGHQCQRNTVSKEFLSLCWWSSGWHTLAIAWVLITKKHVCNLRWRTTLPR